MQQVYIFANSFYSILLTSFLTYCFDVSY